MTLIASILFITAVAASVMAITVTVSDAMPRIFAVIESEFAPSVRTERRISFGSVKQLQALRSADVVAFPKIARVESEFKLAA